MSGRPSLGTFADGSHAAIDLPRLLETRLLIQANSGGGKSWALRRLLEQTAGQVQQLVIDPEGEFATLREKHDYIIAAAHDGDALAHPRTAPLLARRLLETGVSAILDIYDLKAHERQSFVRLFLDALTNSPKSLWRPCLVVLDEAHVYCLSADTEILTREGFQPWESIRPGETEAVCFDAETGTYSYGIVQRLIKRNHSGEMIRLKSDGLDSLTTLDHRVVLKRVQRGVGRYRLYGWTFCEASKVPTCVGVPIGGAPIGSGIADLSTRDARILGWIITDGYWCGSKLGLEQSHATVKAGVSLAEEMRSVLVTIPGVSQYARAARQTASQGRLRNHAATYVWYFAGCTSEPYLRWLGDEIHRVPRQLIEGCNREQLAALFCGLLEGDGTTNKGSWSNFYPGQSSGLADDFQEVALRLGISTTKHWEKSLGQWQVRIADERSMHWVRRPEREHYEGVVWDVTVPTGAFVARRNGRVFVTGNCPEAGKAESAGAVIDLATRGRKRGFCLVAATQRLAKLHKDAAAELLNKAIGRTGLDVDVRRAADELGMTPKQAMAELRGLAAGDFYAFGPALCTSVRKLTVGPVRTTHPKAGDRALKAPPKPTAAIVAVLPKLADLPKEAEAEARTVADLQRELAAARRALTIAEKSKPAPAKEDLLAAESRGFERGLREGRSAASVALKNLRGAVRQAVENAFTAVPGPTESRETPASAPARAAQPRQITAPAPRPTTNGAGTLSAAARKILSVLSQFPEGCAAGKLTLLTGYRYSGSFQNALSELRTAELLQGSNTETMQITEAGREHGPFPELPQGDDLVRYWLNHPSFSKAARLILEQLKQGDERTADDLCAATGYSYSGSFQNALSELRTAGVLIGKNTEAMRISREIIP